MTFYFLIFTVIGLTTFDVHAGTLVVRTCDAYLTTPDRANLNETDKKRLTARDNLRDEGIKGVLELAPVVFGENTKSQIPYEILEKYVGTSANQSPLLVVAHMGWGGEGKTTAFNATQSHVAGRPKLGLNQRAQPANYGAGETRRNVFMVGRKAGAFSEESSAITLENNRRFPDLLTSAWFEGASFEPGPDVFVWGRELPENGVVIDSPGLNIDAQDQRDALRAARLSDILVLHVSQNTVADAFLKNLLKAHFELAGYRRIIFMINGPADEETQRQMRILLIALANHIFGTSGEDMPAGVLGAYVKPNDDRVRQGNSNGTYVPLRNGNLTDSPPYPGYGETLRRALADPMPFRNYGSNHALTAVVINYWEEAKKIVRAQRAAEVYEQAMIVARGNAARHIELQFPYAQQAKQMLRARQSQNMVLNGVEKAADFIPNVLRWMYRGLEPKGTQMVYSAWNSAKEARQKLLARKKTKAVLPPPEVGTSLTVSATPPRPVRSTSDDPEMGDLENDEFDTVLVGPRRPKILEATDALLQPLKSSRITVTDFQAAPAMRLTSLIKEFVRDFGPWDNGAVDRSSGVSLPPMSYLESEVVAKIDQFVGRRAELAVELWQKINDAVVDAADPVKDAANLFGTKNPPNFRDTNAWYKPVRVVIYVMGGTAMIMVKSNPVYLAASLLGMNGLLTGTVEAEYQKEIALIKTKMDKLIAKSTKKYFIKEQESLGSELRLATRENPKVTELFTHLVKIQENMNVVPPKVEATIKVKQVTRAP